MTNTKGTIRLLLAGAALLAVSGVANADQCDVAVPVVPCQVGLSTFDTFVGNYSNARAFYPSSAFTPVLTAGNLQLLLNVGEVPPYNGFAYVANYGTTVWTSPAPYSIAFGEFGTFNEANFYTDASFVWFGVGAPVPELSTGVLAVVGLATLALRRRRTDA